MRVSLSDFHDSRIVLPEDKSIAVLIPTLNLPKARTCILAMYSVYAEAHRSERIKFHVVLPQDDADCMIARNARVLLASEDDPRPVSEQYKKDPRWAWSGVLGDSSEEKDREHDDFENREM